MANVTTEQIQRSKRRLPHVQRSGRSRPLTYWPSYKGALDWLRRHRGILDTALGLLEIYPMLIQDRSMDLMWEFISPFFTPSHTKTTTRVRNRLREFHAVGTPASRNSRQRKPRTAPSLTSSPRAKTAATYSSPAHARDETHLGSFGDSSTASGDTHDLLPLISVTCSQDQPEPELQALFDDEDGGQSGSELPCVYVCSLCQYGRHGNNQHCEQLRQHVLHALQHQFYVQTGPCDTDTLEFGTDELTEVDVYVFVLGESSLNSRACLKRLHALWCLNIPSVFVKDSNYCLPSPLPEAVLQYIHTLESSELPLLSSAKQVPTPRSTTPRCGLSIPTTTISSSLDVKHQKQQPDRGKNGQDSDFMLYLLNGYCSALFFDENNLDGCENLLREKIQFIVGMETSQTGSLPSSPTTSTKGFSQSCSSKERSPQHGNDYLSHLSIMTSIDRSPRKDSESCRLSENEDDKTVSLDRLRNSSGDIPAGVSALYNSNRVPATDHLLSVAYFNTSNHPSGRLGSPPPIKMAPASSVPIVANPPLPPVKSPAARRRHLDPFSHLPHFPQH